MSTKESVTRPQVGCIGGGYWGKNLIRNLNDLGVLSCVCDVDADTRQQLKTAYPHLNCTNSVNRIFADPTIAAVVIATPAATHGEIVRQALLAGKDVFVEKPLCLSVEEGVRLVSLATELQRILMVGHVLWYHPAVRRLKQLIDNGELGRIRYIYSNRLNLGKIRREENILWSFAPHDISVILGLLEEMPDGVYAHAGNYLHDRIADVTVSFLTFPSGIKAHIFVSWLHPFKEQKLIVVGDRQMAVFNDAANTHKLVLYPHSISWRNHVPIASRAEGKSIEVESTEPLKAECAHFLECIRTRRMPQTDGQEALRVLKVLQDCEEALSSVTPLKNKVFSNGLPPQTSFIDGALEVREGSFSKAMTGSHNPGKRRQGMNVVTGPKTYFGNRAEAQAYGPPHAGVEVESGVFCWTPGAMANRIGTATLSSLPSNPAKIVSNGEKGYFVHESAFIDEDVEIGKETAIWHVSHIMKGSRIGTSCRIGQNVVVGPNVRIGHRVKIQNNVSVYEGVTLEDDVFCGPSVVFTNVHNPRSEIRRMDELRRTLVRQGATLGANCTIVCGVMVGRYSFVGAGAVVTKDVPDFALIVGNPGRVAGWMCMCASRLQFDTETETGVCGACGRSYGIDDRQVYPK